MRRGKKPKCKEVNKTQWLALTGLILVFCVSGAFSLSVGTVGGGIDSAINAVSAIFTDDILVGDTADSNPTITLEKSDAGASQLLFNNAGTQRGYITFNSSEGLDVYTTLATPILFGTNATEQMRIASNGNVALFAAAASNQTPGRFTVGGTNASFVVDAATATGGTTAVLGSTSPAVATGPAFWVNGQVCTSVGVGCTNVTFPVWRR